MSMSPFCDVTTWEEFSYDHFRDPDPTIHEEGRTGCCTTGGTKKEQEIWSYSSKPLGKALLRSVAADRQTCQHAVTMFTDILVYTARKSLRDVAGDTRLVEHIFRQAMKRECLQDELYCQLVKQLINNKKRSNEDRCWELLWLCAGCFPCSQPLRFHVTSFLLHKRRSPLARDCLLRLERTVQLGCRRSPPHPLELHTVQKKSGALGQTVVLPDKSRVEIAVESSSRAGDMCLDVANKLGLKTTSGISLYYRVADKAVSIPHGDYYFDFLCSIRPLAEWLSSEECAKYDLLFRRKVWTDVRVGEDPKADLRLHFFQELESFLSGHHKCSKSEAVQLAAYLYRVRFGQTGFELHDDKKTAEVLKDLIPQDLLQIEPPDHWKQDIVTTFNRHAGLNRDDAKLAFLRHVSTWPTFGSAFFHIERHDNRKYPEKLMAAVNRRGLVLMDQNSKNTIVSLALDDVETTGDTRHLWVTGNGLESTWQLTTSAAAQIDDLVKAYQGIRETDSAPANRSVLV
ncbi:myosin-VIIa-like [Branchiostoma floridae]|uniref:Myosin-VIIa-like n=1 Tax=Branchiostoma floridae TaxID=7739 RepID=A0A9J7M4L3_BRAFL|nr:myosin-VIIa-like [Branchiostoma floridae]